MSQLSKPQSKRWRVTAVLAGLTIVVVALSVPASLREAYHRGGFYIFSREFIEDIPARLTGPGRFRFIVQPLVAMLLGTQSGLADALAGRPAYLYGVLFCHSQRRGLLASGFGAVANLLLMGVLLDSICQWIILGTSYPGAALVVGPVMIATPYTVARALANRVAGIGKHDRKTK